jgi:hypothetical protein
VELIYGLSCLGSGNASTVLLVAEGRDMVGHDGPSTGSVETAVVVW